MFDNTTRTAVLNLVPVQLYLGVMLAGVDLLLNLVVVCTVSGYNGPLNLN